ncbi:DUF5050 domain-containing protein [Paenibacillus glufosinatiresistens]|uniref:DUF5050 domain-containing protein n=1 Tax=Paenibacillus glufosinatiresistens TaxID=3070657 RepID=UPI00286EB3EC|nr:DUF5050 domain-containing protein [Paenibacillus sp. YX.27]
MFLKKTVTLLGATALLLGGCGNSGGESNDLWLYHNLGSNIIMRYNWVPPEKKKIELLAAVDAYGEVINSGNWLYYLASDDSIKKTKFNPDKKITVTYKDITFISKKDKQKHLMSDTAALQKDLGVSDEILLFNGRASNLALDKDTLYFVNEDEEDNIYSMKTDGTGLTPITNEELVVEDLDLAEDWVVYATMDGLFAVKKDGSDHKQLLDESVDWVGTGNDWIYYSDSMADEPVIQRIKSDGSQKMDVLSGEFDEPHVKGDWIYYYRGEDHYRCKGDGTGEEKIN